ncbi:unnamed protein product, partial [Effrenium voratum]
VNIGSMVKSGHEEGVQSEDVTLCGMLTVLNLRQFAKEQWCKQLAKLLEAKAGDCLELKQYTQSSERQVGFVVAERFVNLPLELLPAMHKAILEDIEWSCTVEYCPEEERPFYFFTHFLCVASCRAVAGTAEGPLQLQLKTGSVLQFSRPEELVLARAASFIYSFLRPQPKDGSGMTL